MALTFTRLRTPVGELVLTASDTALTGVYFPTSRRGPAPTHQAGWVEATAGPAADVLARARQQLVRVAARSPRLRVRAPRVERAAPDPLRHDHELRRARQTPGRQARHPRRRPRQRQEPDPHHRPVPSGRGIKGRADGLRWGIGNETVAAGTR